MNRRTKNIRIFSLLLALLLVAGLFAGCGENSEPSSQSSESSAQSSESSAQSSESSAQSSESSSQQGSAVSAAVKNITVKVVHKDGSEKEFAIAAQGETLREALEQEKLVEGEDGQYGLFIKSADGETADDGNQEWWCVTKGGEQVNTGVDGVKIADGDVYELTLTVGS